MTTTVAEVSFSLKPWGSINKSKLPASAFLIVGEPDKKATWHLPYRDDTGKVNVGALRAIRVILKSGQFRGRKISFQIPQEVRDKVNRWWEEWQKKKAAMATARAAVDAVPVEGLVVDGWGTVSGPELAEALAEDENPPAGWEPSLEVGPLASVAAATYRREHLCGILTPIVPMTEAVFEDNKREAVLTVLESGWSENGNYYSSEKVEALVPHLLARPKAFRGHVYGSERDKIDRDPADLVYKVLEAWVEEGPSSKTGQTVRKARARAWFPSGPNGWIYEALKQDPTLFGNSINALVYAKKGEAEGRKGVVVEDWHFLFSTDVVSYPSAGGSFDTLESVGRTPPVLEGVYDPPEGWREKEGSRDDGDNPLEPARFALDLLKEALHGGGPLDLNTRLATEQARKKFWDLLYAFEDLVRDVIQSEEAGDAAARKILIAKAAEDFKNQITAMDLTPLLPTSSAAAAQTEKTTTEETEPMTKEQILKDAALTAELKDHFAAELRKELDAVKEELEAKSTKLAEYEAKEARARRLNEVIKMAEEIGLTKDLLTDEFIAFCADLKSEEPERWREQVEVLLKDRRDSLARVAALGHRLGTGNSRPAEEAAAAVLLRKDQNGSERPKDEELLARFQRRPF